MLTKCGNRWALTGEADDLFEVFFQVFDFRQRRILHVFRDLSLALLKGTLDVL